MSTGNMRSEGDLPGFAAGKARSYSRSVGSFVPGLTRKAFEQFGFATADLLVGWETIAGADLARFTRPQSLTWRRVSAAVAEGSDGDARGRATLVIAADPARALEVEYGAQQIKDRINAFFGYAAIERLKVVQASAIHNEIAPAVGRNMTAEVAPPPPNLEAVDNHGLKVSLAGLWANIHRDKSAVGA